MNGIETPAEILILVFMIPMMVVGFILLYGIFRRDSISSRILFLDLAIILYMSVLTVVIAYLDFWNGNKLVAFLILIASAAIFALPIFLKGVIRDWRSHYRYTIPAVVTLIFYELAMGFLFGSAFLPHNSSPFLLAINNVDFSAMMIIEAIFFLLISRKSKGLFEFALFTFALGMAMMPTFFIELGNLPFLITMLLSSLVMVINILILYILQIRTRTSNFQITVVVLAASDFMMMIGLSLYAANRNLAFMSVAMTLSMVAYFFLLTHRLPSNLITSYRTYSSLLLVLINGAELTMGLGVTSLGFSITNSLFSQSATSYASVFSGLDLARQINFSNPLWWLFPFDPIKMTAMAFHSGLNISPYFAPFWSSFVIVMMTTMSPFYVIMMGSEMSYLVLERYRHARSESVKKWSLAIIAGIPLFVILVPFYTPIYIFGMSGMLFSVSLVLFVISVSAIVVASVLFGRRVQCNLVCMAAHMWTNEYYDRFKPKGDHPSVWNILRWISFSVMIVSFGAFVLVVAGVLPPIMIGSMTMDPLIFYGMFILNYIWWLFYFLTPIFGAYSCARQGWCGFGTLSGIFNKLFFKIRVMDRNVCERCETGACESNCPTAIPIRADFLRKGSSNKITCIGCGDCVEACPMENLRIMDVRDYIRRGPLKNPEKSIGY